MFFWRARDCGFAMHFYEYQMLAIFSSMYFFALTQTNFVQCVGTAKVVLRFAVTTAANALKKHFIASSVVRSPPSCWFAMVRYKLMTNKLNCLKMQQVNSLTFIDGTSADAIACALQNIHSTAIPNKSFWFWGFIAWARRFFSLYILLVASIAWRMKASDCVLFIAHQKDQSICVKHLKLKWWQFRCGWICFNCINEKHDIRQKKKKIATTTKRCPNTIWTLKIKQILTQNIQTKHRKGERVWRKNHPTATVESEGSE